MVIKNLRMEPILLLSSIFRLLRSFLLTMVFSILEIFWFISSNCLARTLLLNCIRVFQMSSFTTSLWNWAKESRISFFTTSLWNWAKISRTSFLVRVDGFLLVIN